MCRQGARVTAVEAHGSTADLCQSIICVNQALGNITVHHKDARHLSIGPDLPCPHDVLVFEVVLPGDECHYLVFVVSSFEPFSSRLQITPAWGSADKQHVCARIL